MPGYKIVDTHSTPSTRFQSILQIVGLRSLMRQVSPLDNLVGLMRAAVLFVTDLFITISPAASTELSPYMR